MADTLEQLKKCISRVRITKDTTDIKKEVIQLMGTPLVVDYLLSKDCYVTEVDISANFIYIRFINQGRTSKMTLNSIIDRFFDVDFKRIETINDIIND